MDASNLENALQNINRYINIDKQRQEYARIYTNLRDKIFSETDGLRSDPLFKTLYNGWQLEGSYGDNLKITSANEFDLVFLLKLPYYRKIKWNNSWTNPGHVEINVNDVLNELIREKNKQPMLKLLNGWVNESKKLKLSAINPWLTSLFTKTLNKLKYEIQVDLEIYVLKLAAQGPAQTIYVYRKRNMEFMLSVDFVPGIQLQMHSTYDFEAIPKPLKTPDVNYTLFRESHYEREREIIKDCHGLKNALRLMKKCRDKNQNMSFLKSYFIKTIFLWQAKDKSREYWRSPLSKLVIDMFSKLEDYLTEENLPFYWDRRCNLFEDFTPSHYKELLNCVKSQRKILESPNSNINAIYRMFLTTNEIKDLQSASIEAQFDDTSDREADLTPPSTELFTSTNIAAAAGTVAVVGGLAALFINLFKSSSNNNNN